MRTAPNKSLTLVGIVAANVRRLMRLRNIRAVDLADKMDCSRQYIYLIRTGRGNVTLESLEKLAEALEVKPGELLRTWRLGPGIRRGLPPPVPKEQDAVIA